MTKEHKEHKEKKHKDKKHKKDKHKDKKHKEKKHKEEKHKHKTHKEGQQKQQQPTATAAAAPNAAAAAAPAVQPAVQGASVLPGFAPASGPPPGMLPTPRPPASLLSTCKRLKVKPLLNLAAAAEGEEEVWVLRLPPGLKLELLHGRKLHMPCEPPEARHLKPTPNPFLDPTVDLLAHVRAHVQPTPIGHLALPHKASDRADVHRFRELHQEDEFVVKRLRVVGPTTDHRTKRLSMLKVARYISISDDVFTLDRECLGEAMSLGVPAWGKQDGWDGQLPQRKHRKRIAGVKVLGKRPRREQEQIGSGSPGDEGDDESGGSGSDNGSDSHATSSEEEFDEEVFLERQEGGGSGGDGAADGEGDKSPVRGEDYVSDSLKDEAMADEGADEVQQGGEGDGSGSEVDWDERFYSSGSDSGSEDEVAQLLAAAADNDLDVEKFLLSLPVKADIAAQQQIAARLQMPKSSKRQKQTQQQSGGGGGSSDDGFESDGDDGEDAAAAGGESNAAQQQQPPASRSDSPESELVDDDVAAAAAAAEAAVKEELPPKPISEMLQLPWHITSHMEGLPPKVALHLRNLTQMTLVDWRDVCAQVDMDRMSDGQVDLLLRLLQGQQMDNDERGDEEVLQTSRLLLPSAGPGPRPHYTDVDQGYAPYQPGEAPPVLPRRQRHWRSRDAELAADLLAQGAGRLARFVDTTELRSKGFAWDSDPEEEQKEGLHIETADGRLVHIPSGL